MQEIWISRLLLVLALVLAPSAGAATTYPALNAVMSEAAQRPVQGACHTAEEWAGLAPSTWFGYVTFYGGVPESVAHFAPGVCETVSAFMASPTRDTQKQCQSGFRTETVTETITEWHTEERTRVETRRRLVWLREKVRGRWKRVRRRVPVRVEIFYTVDVPVQVTRTVEQSVPNIITCPDWATKTQMLHIMIHETAHMAGWQDEAIADCWAMKSLRWFAWRLGAPLDFAAEIQADEWVAYSRHPYFSPSCTP